MNRSIEAPFESLAPFALIDSDDGAAHLFTDCRYSLPVEGDDASSPTALARLFADIDAATAAGYWVLIAADYGLGPSIEPAAEVPAGSRQRLRAWVFASCTSLDADAVAVFLGQRLAVLLENERMAGIANWQPTLAEAEYRKKVEQVKAWIAAGDCYQINLTFPVQFRVYGHPLALYASLRTRQPVRYGAFVSLPDATILSFSPELFFSRSGDRVVTRPMKGTAPRGATPLADAALRAGLLASEKERAENVMIVDLLRNDLGRLAAPGRVRVDALCEAEAYPTVWQQVSTVSADLPEVSLAALFGVLFPCGSITGAPKIRAMQRISELEESSRDLYTGALGWIAPGGDCRFNVAIRTFELAPDGQARLGVGSGIVIDADPGREYAECLLKAQFLSAFDPGFELIETLRLENGAYPLLSLHFDRLRRSAETLGFKLDEGSLHAALSDAAGARPMGIFRVRLSLAHGGAFTLTVAVLEARERAWHVILADEPLPDGEFLRGHKTSVRRRYDQALACLPDGVIDVLFFNTRGEVCEGARSNVFVVRDGVWLTPPLSSGVLPGVMRRTLLESGRAVEQVLYRDDLFAATGLYVANALRGLIPVSLASYPAGGGRLCVPPAPGVLPTSG